MPDFSFENELQKQDKNLICGVDEAGRGPLAGPVVVACVMFCSYDEQMVARLFGLNDSKKLSENKRAKLFEIIISMAHVGICALPPKIIDEKNILQATLYAMERAVLSLSPSPEHILIDGRDIPKNIVAPASAIIKGDSKSLSIAAASIIAKQVRDSMCPVMDKDFMGYDFAKHKGYGTKIHLEALKKHGASIHHRFSYAPVARAKRAINT